MSYSSLKDEINKHFKSIKRKTENRKFSYSDYKDEFSILSISIDDNEEHYNELKERVSKLCRYSDIKTYKRNNLEINTESKYINASPINIKGKMIFITTQGPKPNTIEDFWTMIEQYICNLIIMLCNLIEGEREKCANYWDANDTIKKYSLNYNEKATEFNTIVQREIKLFNDFLYMIKKADELKGDEPIVVHCSAGVRRTGTFISMYVIYNEIMKQIENENLENIHFSVFNMVRKLKEMGLYMVQSIAQYKFIYDFIDY